jgi:uncharacterized protein
MLSRAGDAASTGDRLAPSGMRRDSEAGADVGLAEGMLALTDTLFPAESIWEERLADDRWVVFAPDAAGLPAVVPDEVRALLRAFDGGRTVGAVLEGAASATSALPTIAFLLDNGYLGFEPSPLPYSLPPDSEIELPSAVEVWLHLLNACNLRCGYCFVGEARVPALTEETARSTARTLAATARKHNLKKVTVKFAGGEPTLALPCAEAFRDELEARLAGTSTKAAFALLTNGTVLNERVLAFLKRPSTSLTISIDGYCGAHDTFRIYRSSGEGSWKTIVANLDVLHAHGIKPFITATISGETCDTLPQLLRWIHNRRLRTRLNVVRQPDCSWERTPETDSAYARLCERLAAAFDRAFEELQRPEYSFAFVSGLRVCDLHIDSPVLASCGVGFNHIVVKPDGHIVACPMNINESGVEAGDDLLDACRRSVPYDRMERHGNVQCRSCRWFPVCAGGCPITNQRMNGQAFSRSPFCDLYRHLIPAYIRLLAHKMVRLQTIGGTNAYTH